MTEVSTQPETTFQLFKIVEDGDIFEPLKSVNQIQGNFLSVDLESDDYDGTFPRVSDWTRLVNKIDSEGASAFLTWLGGSKLKFDLDTCTVVRESKYSDKATLLFKNPIKVIIGHLNNEPITIDVNKIVGEFTYEWSCSKRGRQDKVANICELFFDCKEYHNTTI